MKYIKDSDLNSSTAWSTSWGLWECQPARTVQAKPGSPLALDTQALNTLPRWLKNDIALSPIDATTGVSFKNPKRKHEETENTEAQHWDTKRPGKWSKVIERDFRRRLANPQSRLAESQGPECLTGRIIHPKSQFWSSHCLVQGQWPFNLRNTLLNLHSNSSETWSHLPIPLICSYTSLYILHSSGMGWITSHSLFIQPNMGPGVRSC